MTGTLLDGRTAVVTGGASGIGRAIAEAYAAEGASVVVADLQAEPRDREDDAPTHERLAEEYGADATYVDCDVTSVDDLRAAVDAAEPFGGVDVMVNNAGVFHREEFLDVTEADYERLMDVNVKGVYFGAQAAAAAMLDRGDGGVVLNMSSVAGLTGTAGYATYTASKGAVRLLTYSLADELGPEGIRVNAIHPGIIETAMTTEDVALVGTDAGERYEQSVPLRRFGQPEEVAGAAVYLASDLASYVTGESLVVDGGMTRT